MMANKEIWLPFKIQNFVNIRRNGKWVCHVLIEEADLEILKKGTIYESTDAIIDKDQQTAAKSHVFLGHNDVDDVLFDDEE